MDIYYIKTDLNIPDMLFHSNVSLMRTIILFLFIVVSHLIISGILRVGGQ